MNNYLTFLKAHHQFIDNTPLDLFLEQLLQEIAIFNDENDRPARCSDLIGRDYLGSPATIHKNYHVLIELGYLKLRKDTQDGRIKYIELTEKAKNFFNKINGLMDKCKKR